MQFSARYAFSGKTSFNAALEYYSQSRDGFGILGRRAPTFDGSRNSTVSLLLGAHLAAVAQLAGQLQPDAE